MQLKVSTIPWFRTGNLFLHSLRDKRRIAPRLDLAQVFLRSRNRIRAKEKWLPQLIKPPSELLSFYFLQAFQDHDNCAIVASDTSKIESKATDHPIQGGRIV